MFFLWNFISVDELIIGFNGYTFKILGKKMNNSN